ncbi:major facilitator superfamily domain-containing protein 10-like [Corticium candelabrum]|uniref:major facilitator superfamily domain-containing protein 10-like n=1 Tax=Corticium candelabrum TaxID=121492 RepID=UPI002E262066|nr:major facilitator superfamily domain-containing protein 10-like [Corticium candelabrum]
MLRSSEKPHLHDETSSQLTDDEKAEKDRARSAHKAIFVVFLSLLIDLIAFTCILPLMPSILDYYSRTDQQGLYSYLLEKVRYFRTLVGAPDTSRYDTVLFGGLLGSLFSFLQFFSSPMIGSLSDVYGRRPVLLLSMMGIAFSYAVWAVSRDFSWFVLARVIGGVSKGNVSLSTAIMTDVTSSKNRSKGMAVIGVAFSIAFIVGPIMGAIFSRYTVTTVDVDVYPFARAATFSCCLALVDIVFVWWFFKETLPKNQKTFSIGSSLVEAWHLINPFSLFQFSAMHSLQSADLKRVRILGFSYFLYLLLFSGLEYSLTFLTHERFHFSGMEQGKMFLFIGIIMILTQGVYVRRRPSGFELQTATQGIAILMPGMIMIGCAQGLTLLFSGLALYSFGAGTVVPFITSLISQHGSDMEKGRIMGIFRSLGALARALGPGLACAIYWSFSAITCYLGGALLLVVPLMMLSLARNKAIE